MQPIAAHLSEDYKKNNKTTTLTHKKPYEHRVKSNKNPKLLCWSGSGTDESYSQSNTNYRAQMQNDNEQDHFV